MTDEFGARWLECYLPTLQQRTKWLKQTKNSKVSDLLLITDETRCRGYWSMGLTEEVFRDDMEVVGSAKTRTNSKHHVLDIQKICLLEAVDKVYIEIAAVPAICLTVCFYLFV